VNEDLHFWRNERSFSGAEERMTIVLQFLERYYQLYDSDNRTFRRCIPWWCCILSIISTYPLDESSTTSFGEVPTSGYLWFEVSTAAKVYILGHPEYGGTMWYPPTRLHGFISKTTIWSG
jgi:hypothetical protein